MENDEYRNSSILKVSTYEFIFKYMTFVQVEKVIKKIKDQRAILKNFKRFQVLQLFEEFVFNKFNRMKGYKSIVQIFISLSFFKPIIIKTNS